MENQRGRYHTFLANGSGSSERSLLKGPTRTQNSLTPKAETSIQAQALLRPSPPSLPLHLCMDLNLPSSTPSSTSRDDLPFPSVSLPENSPPEHQAGLSLDLETPPPHPLQVQGFFYNLLNSQNPVALNDDHCFTIEGSSSNPFSRVVSTPWLDLPFHHPSAEHHPTATFPRGFDLFTTARPPTLPPPPPRPSLDTSPKTSEGSDGTVAHGQLEFKSLFDYGPVDHHHYQNPVTVDRQIMRLLDLNDPASTYERLGEEFSLGGVISNHQGGHERDDGGDDRSKREVVIGLPQQLQRQTTGKKRRCYENDKEALIVKGQWTAEEDRLRHGKTQSFV